MKSTLSEHKAPRCIQNDYCITQKSISLALGAISSLKKCLSLVAGAAVYVVFTLEREGKLVYRFLCAMFSPPLSATTASAELPICMEHRTQHNKQFYVNIFTLGGTESCGSFSYLLVERDHDREAQ